MRKTIFLQIMFSILLLSNCNGAESKFLHTNTATVSGSLATTITVTNTHTPSTTPTIKPTSTITPIPEYELLTDFTGGDGFLWMYSSESKHNNLLNFSTMKYKPVIGCDEFWAAIPNSTLAVCQDGRYLSLFNFLTGEKERLPVRDVEWVHVTQDAQYMYYGNWDRQHKTQDIYIYDLITREESLFLTDFPMEIKPVYFPELGKMLYFGYQDEFFWIGKGDTEPELFPINYRYTYIAWGIAPSPDSETILLGDRTFYYEFAEYNANRLLLLDLSTGKVELLATAENGVWIDQGYNWKVESFSPDGKRVVALFLNYLESRKDGDTSKELCIIELETKQKTCRKIPYDYWDVGAVCWSPDGDKIAFTAGYDDDLFIYSLEEDELYLLLPDTKIEALVWR